MKRLLSCLTLSLLPMLSPAATPADQQAIERAVLDYIESQHKADPALMVRGLDERLAKRTYWEAADGKEFVMQTDYETMLKVARTFNKDGTRFPQPPRVEIKVLDIDQRVATVKLTADEWIDYMHLYRNQGGDWKIINVLWQYHDVKRQTSRK